MLSFTLLTLASSTLALPVLNGVANLPVNGVAPVDAASDAAAKLVAPVKVIVDADIKNINAANGILSGNNLRLRGVPVVGVLNAPVDVKAPVDVLASTAAEVSAPVNALTKVNVEDVNAFNGIASGNTIRVRAISSIANAPVNVDAPIDAAVDTAVKAIAPVTGAVDADIKNTNIGNGIASGNNIVLPRAAGDPLPDFTTVLTTARDKAAAILAKIKDTSDAHAIAGHVAELKAVVEGALGQLNPLKGKSLSLEDLLRGTDAHAAAGAVHDLVKTSLEAVQHVNEKLGDAAPELRDLLHSLAGSVSSVLSNVTALAPGLVPLLAGLLKTIASLLPLLGLAGGLPILGL